MPYVYNFIPLLATQNFNPQMPRLGTNFMPTIKESVQIMPKRHSIPPNNKTSIHKWKNPSRQKQNFNPQWEKMRNTLQKMFIPTIF
jgi:hypothetical protein